jgi:hypothetical protein
MGDPRHPQDAGEDRPTGGTVHPLHRHPEPPARAGVAFRDPDPDEDEFAGYTIGAAAATLDEPVDEYEPFGFAQDEPAAPARGRINHETAQPHSAPGGTSEHRPEPSPAQAAPPSALAAAFTLNQTPTMGSQQKSAAPVEVSLLGRLLALANATPAHAAGPPGSAPIRTPRRRSMRRPARARDRNGSRRSRREWIGVASLAVPLIVLAFVVHGSSHTRATDSTPVVASVHEPGLTTLRHPVVPATREIAAIAQHASSDRARDNARRAATARKQPRTSRRPHSVARVHHTAIAVDHTSPSDRTVVTPATVTPAAPVSSPTSAPPASTATGSATTSNSTPATRHSSGSPSPPVYGEGGVLGAGHGG